ncbi:MAG: hypothetical protein KBT85_12195 [Pseudomonas sp.]|nr:hypothetical protein [Pseudomonas sp.]MBQ0776949.1 hypothetical protein [Pseudomonas sp.]|tara:strand:- start:385 stop:528 length:144 start_codon:yes stop_codon:yes gene_type:complete
MLAWRGVRIAGMMGRSLLLGYVVNYAAASAGVDVFPTSANAGTDQAV